MEIGSTTYLAQVILSLMFGALLGAIVMSKVRPAWKRWVSKEHARFAREESLTKFFNYIFLIDDTPLSRTYLLKEMSSREVNRLFDKYYDKINVLSRIPINAQEALTFLELSKNTLAEYTNLLSVFYLSRASYRIPELDRDLYKILHSHVFSNKRKIAKKGLGLLNRAQGAGFKRIQKDDILKNLYLEVVNFANNALRPDIKPERVGLKSIINPQPIEFPIAQVAHIAIYNRYKTRQLVVKYSGLEVENAELKKENSLRERKLSNAEKEIEKYKQLTEGLTKRLEETQKALNSKEDVSLIEMLKVEVDRLLMKISIITSENSEYIKEISRKDTRIGDLEVFEEYAKFIETTNYEDNSEGEMPAEVGESFADIFNGRRAVIAGGIAAWRISMQEVLKNQGVPYLIIEPDSAKKLPPLLSTDVVVFNRKGVSHVDYRKIMSKTGTEIPVIVVGGSNVDMTLYELSERVPHGEI